MEPQIVRKSAFAEMRGVSAGRVSQWISEGKITGAALVGEGRAAMINVALACEQLKVRLDVSQRFGLNGVSTNLEAPKPAVELPLVDTVEGQIKEQKLRQAQLQTARLEEEDRLRRGVYVDAQAAKAELSRVAADMLKVFEGALPDFASALAAKFHLPHRDALHLLRGEFRRARERASLAAANAGANLPRTLPADEPEPTSVQ